MPLELLDTAPGVNVAPVTPWSPVQFSLKTSDIGQSIELGTLLASMGYTNVQNSGLLPDLDPNLADLGALVNYQTSEHRLPIAGSVPVSEVSPGILFSKSDNSDFDTGIYEVKFPIESGASIMGYFKFKVRTAWTTFNPDWCNLTNMVGMYFGLEHGTFNNAAYFFLRNNGGGGSAVLGGPLQTFNSARPGQEELAFSWTTLPDLTDVEVWIFYNVVGYPPPFSPSFVPVVEIWARRAGVDTEPVILAQQAVGSFGQFQPSTDLFTNTRAGPSDYATLYFGNVGRAGDSLQLDDWAFFPDYRVVAIGGGALPSAELSVLPDCLVEFQAAAAVLPDQISPGPWLPIADTGFIHPAEAFTYQSGSNITPYSLALSKTALAAAGFQKVEPQLSNGADGAMVEGFLYGSAISTDGDSFGAGMAIEDGTSMFKVLLIRTATTSTIGILHTLTDKTINGYYYPSVGNGTSWVAGAPPLLIDWTTPHLIRLTVDKKRLKVGLYVDEVLTLEIPTGSPSVFPPSAIANGRISFGHLYPLNSSVGTVNFVSLNYSPRFEAWEARDNVLPETLNPDSQQWVLNKSDTGGTAFDTTPTPNFIILTKKQYAVFGTYLYYSHNDNFGEDKGCYVDFDSKVMLYTDSTGQTFAQGTWTGSALTIFLGNKRLQLGFFDCGVNGRCIGVIPGSGSVDDIINQTALGKAFSAQVNWATEMVYRVVLKAFDSIEVWANTTLQQPLIKIPWQNATMGFDLPLDSTTPAIAFGHFDYETSSQVGWRYIRWGIGDGYEVAMRMDFQSGLQPYLFGGKVFVRTTFDEV